MATTVAQHSVATFTSPVNGTTPIDANTVRGNDNTTRAAYNDHDADPGIHVQSSTLASRPVAGTAGRKWITEDSSVYTLWFDDGTHWHPVSSENIALTVLAGENLVKGDVVKVTGWNNGQDLPEVVKTTSAADTAFAVITATVTSGSLGYATNTGIVQDVNTAAYSVGTILYANGSGGFTSTKPTSGNYQPVAYVMRSNTNNGVYYVEFSTPRIVERSDNTASTVVLRDASGNFAAGTITATTLNATTVNATTFDMTNLEVTNIKAKDGTSAATIADSTGVVTFTSTVSGSITGNAGTATALQTARNINGVSFNGTADITVTAAAGTLTGTTLASGVTASSLTSVGTLSSLTVSGDLTVDTSTLKVDSANNRVGIGTTSPLDVFDAKLAANKHILLNTAYTTGADIAAVTDAGGQVKLGLAGSSIGFYTGVTEKMLLDASGNLAVDTNTLYVDAANNRVGVGTASPAQALHISGSGATYAQVTGEGFASFLGSDGIGTFVGNTSATKPLYFGTNSTEKMRLDTAGNLGLGVTPSAWSSSYVAMQVGASASVFGSKTGETAIVQSNGVLSSTGYKYILSAPATQYSQGNGVHSWFTAPSGTAGNAITFTQAMTLDASGNLGVGLSNPGARLHVRAQTNGNMMFQNSVYVTGGVLLNTVNDASSASVPLDIQASTIQFAISGTERARIDASGNLGVGTASPASRLHVVGISRFSDGTTTTLLENGGGLSYFGTITNHPLVFTTNNAERARITSGGDFRVGVGATNAGVLDINAASGVRIIDAINATGNRYFEVQTDGDVYNTNGTYGTLSDARFKQDIIDATSQWADMKAVRFRKYRMKTDVAADANAPYQLGVIAQELEATSPGLVDEHPNEDGTTTKTVKSSILLMKAAVALQEAMARIETLEQRVLALEA